MLDENTRYRLLSLLEENPALSQRQLSELIGISLGKTNFCLKALIHKGLIKVHNFRNSHKRSAYMYKLTPTGMNEKIRVTKQFLRRKVREHEELTDEIERLRAEVQSHQRTIRYDASKTP